MHKRYVVTVMAPAAVPDRLVEVQQLISAAGLKTLSVDRSAVPGLLHASVAQIQASGAAPDLTGLKPALLKFSEESGIDVVLQTAQQFGRPRRLIVFDMDSTLIQAEIIDELAKIKGVGDEVARVTEAAMRGELDFKQSFTRRLGLLRGIPEEKVFQLLERVPMWPGAEKLVQALKARGFKTGILSGGFTFFGRHLQSRLGIDYLFANELEIVAGHVTGEVVPPIMDGQRKAEMLRRIAEGEGIPLEEAIAVGDGANDLPMLQLAGMGIAYRAKPLVRQTAQHAISALGLDAILPLLGLEAAGSSAVQ